MFYFSPLTFKIPHYPREEVDKYDEDGTYILPNLKYPTYADFVNDKMKEK